MRKEIFVFAMVFILILPVVSSVNINMKGDFSQGETLFSTIDGNFVKPLQKSNIYFYRDHVRISFAYDLVKLNEKYYLYAQLGDKAPDNYSVVIKGVDYYVGGGISDKEVRKYFTVGENFAEFKVSDLVFIVDGSFELQIENLKSSSNEISFTEKVLSGYSEGEFQIWAGTKKIEESHNFLSGQKKTFEIFIDEISENSIRKIILESENTKYEIFVSVSPPSSGSGEPVEPGCGDGVKNSGEQCDEIDFGIKDSCSDFNSDWEGDISCSDECVIDFSGCSVILDEENYTETGEDCLVDWNCKTDEGEKCINKKCVVVSSGGDKENDTEEIECGNGILEIGESCDKKDFGNLNCESIFDEDWLGDLVCTSDCKINSNECYEIVNSSKGQNCLVDWNCRSDEKCIEKVCTKIIYASDNGTIDNETEIPDVDVNESVVNESKKSSEGCRFIDELFGRCGLNQTSNGSEIIEENEEEYEIVLEDNGDVVVVKDGKVLSEGVGSLQTCSELEGSVCTSSQICQGDSVYAKDNVCCVGSCVKQDSSGENNKLVGWVLIGIVVLLLLIFFAKFKNSSKRKKDMLLRRR